MVAVCALALTTSCGDFLNEESKGKIFDSYLQTQNGLEAALTGAYRGLNTPWAAGLCNGTYHQITAGGDDMYLPTTDANGTEIDRCGVTDGNGSVGSTWNGLFKVIVNANKVIANYESCTGSQDVIKVIAGEAYFLRAYANFILCQLWGDMPLMLSPNYNVAEATMAPSSPAKVYEQIEKDLENAVELLGNERRNGEVGRPNKLVARALRAEVYLVEAGWPLKKDGYYAKAADEAKAVLDGAASANFELENDFKDLFRNIDKGDNITKEDLFVIPASVSDICVFYGWWSEPGEIGGWNILFAEVQFFKDFPEGVRKDYTFYTKTPDGRSWETWEKQHPSYLKLMMLPQNGYSSCSASIPAHMLRLSQTALTYAEAAARSGSVTDEAYQWLNKIRTRAGLSTYSGLSREDFIKAVVDERKWEFAGENVRWYDILRLELEDEVFAGKDNNYDPGSLHPAGDKDYTFPIPATETLVNPNLK